MVFQIDSFYSVPWFYSTENDGENWQFSITSALFCCRLFKLREGEREYLIKIVVMLLACTVILSKYVFRKIAHASLARV